MLLRLVGCTYLLSLVAFCQQPAGNSAYQAEMEREQKLHATLAIGSPAPEFSLKGSDGKFHSLAEYKSSPILAVVFLCNHCPKSQLYERRIKGIVTDYGARGVQLIAIQPNGPLAVSPRELNYTDLDDSYESMVIHAQYRHFNFPYLYDGDTQAVVAKFGPKVTPHIFIFDSSRKLAYEGRIDDNGREDRVKVHDARNALDALLAGQPVPVAHTPVFGCSTKWNDQIESKKSEMKKWESQPVNLESANAEDLKKLRENPTGKTLMINFWATWCGPCVEEFHDLLTTYLWYRSRDFDFVTVSTNSPEERPAVLKFLEQQHSAVRNLQFASDNVYDLQAAFDPAWDSGVPYTVVLAPGGKVIYRSAGAVDILALRRAVLAVLPDGGFSGNAAYWAAK